MSGALFFIDVNAQMCPTVPISYQCHMHSLPKINCLNRHLWTMDMMWPFLIKLSSLMIWERRCKFALCRRKWVAHVAPAFRVSHTTNILRLTRPRQPQVVFGNRPLSHSLKLLQSWSEACLWIRLTRQTAEEENPGHGIMASLPNLFPASRHARIHVPCADMIDMLHRECGIATTGHRTRTESNDEARSADT